ncbi:MAG: heparinase II/III family protein [Chitinophagaceae bacterium]
MKKILYLFFALLLFKANLSMGQQDTLTSSAKLPAHPRLLLLKGQEAAVKNNIGKDALLQKIHASILKDCDEMISQPPVEHIKIGKRLLDKSRECLRRVFYLSYAYRTTGQRKYLERAEKEMLAVSAFSDWNPSHFLDVAEMTMAVSIGYDWLYNDLSKTSRKAIEDAILEKGIKPSLDKEYNSWLTRTNNWNQVCNAGIVFGAMVTYEAHPELSLQIVNRAINTLSYPLQQYAPDGGYPEGYGYWGYGTSFNVMLVSALDAAFGKDFGLTKAPGFMQTASFMENMLGPSGKPYNFSDCGTTAEFNPAMFWFASHTKTPSLLWMEKQLLSGNMPLKNRLLPATMIWAKDIDMNKVVAPVSKTWFGSGVNPVALMRTSWTDPKAIFVGFKGGSPSLSHAHMDVGSFVMEADGVRWAIDLGMQEYETLESKGVDLWNMKQNSQRWSVYRYNNLAHNTLTVNNELQQVTGSAKITENSGDPEFTRATADLTSLYGGKLKSATRMLVIMQQSYVVVHDELETAGDSVTVRWTMVTPATVKITKSNVAELSKDGKTLVLAMPPADDLTLKTWPATPTNSYDAANPGVNIIAFEMKLPPHTKQPLHVMLMPEKAAIEKGFR